MEKLVEFAPRRDYNRAISMPAVEATYPKPIQDLLVYINTRANKVAKDEQTKIQGSLGQVEGMIDVDEKNKEIFDQLNKVVENDNSMKLIAEKADELLKTL